MASPLFNRSQPGGINTIYDPTYTSGNIFFVSSTAAGAADSVGAGRDPDKPFATIDYAIGQCTASNGDKIFVLPYHAETVAGAAGINLDVAGVSVIAVGEGAARPTITMSAVASTIGMNAAGCQINGFLILFTEDVTIGVDINAADCIVRNCEFRNKLTATAKEAVTMIDVTSAANAADRTLIEGCKFYAQTAGTTQAIELGEVNDKVRIRDCEAWGDYSTACIHNPTGKVLTLLTIEGCTLQNVNSGSHSIELVSACTGALKENFYHNAMTQATCVDPGSCFSFQCFQDDVVDTSGILTPAVT